MRRLKPLVYERGFIMRLFFSKRMCILDLYMSIDTLGFTTKISIGENIRVFALFII